MSDFSALAYLEGRQIANTVTDIVRKPQRLLLYVFVAAYFGFLIWSRTLGHNRAIPGIPDPWVTLIGLGAILAAGFAILRAADGNVAAFASAAEARFLIGSRMSERNVAVWLALRNSARMLLRLLFVIILYAILYHGIGGPMAIALSMTCVIIGGVALGIPVFKLSRHFGKLPCKIGAFALIAIAIAGAAVVAWGWLSPHPAGIRATIATWGPGHIITQALSGNWAVLAIGFAIDAALIAVAYFGASDIYPELNQGSAKHLQALARGRRGIFSNLGRSEKAGTKVKSVSAPAGFTGAAAILWKDWVSLRRATSSYMLFWGTLGLAIVAGLVLGIWGQTSAHARLQAISFGVSLGFIIVIIGTMYSAVSLAADIGKPLWWLSDSTMRTRLYAWTAASCWRVTACAGAGLIAWSIATHKPMFAVIGIPVSALLALFSRAVGLALYSLFPSSLDQRGPAAMGRMLGMYVSLVPPLGIGLAVGLFAQHLSAGLAAAAIVAIAELLGLIEFASARIRKNGVAIAQAEST